MPLSTTTELAALSASASGATHVTGSASPTAGALVLVPFGSGWGFGPTSISSVTSAFAIEGSWTVVVESDPFGSREIISGWAWAIASGSPGSGTVTITWANSFSQVKAGGVFEIATGFDSSTPIRSGATDFAGTASLAATTDLSGTLATAPLSTSRVLSYIFGRESNTTYTPGSGYTLVGSAVAGNNHSSGVAERGSSTSTAFAAQFGAIMSAGAAISAIEIQEAAAASVPPSVFQNANQIIGY